MRAALRPAVFACALAAALGAQAQAPVAAPGTAAADALRIADAHVARRDWAGARSVLEQRLAQVPEDDAARFLLARVRAWQGEPAAALPLYAALLSREPDNADYLLGYGQAQLWAGRRDAAIAALERAQRLAPGYADVDRALAQARESKVAATGAGAEPRVDAPAGPAAPASTPSATAAPSDTASASQSGSTAPSVPSPAADVDGASPGAAVAVGPDQDAPRPAATGAVADSSPTSERRRSIVLTGRYDRLDRGYDDWRAWRLDAAATGGERVGVTGALFTESRFGLDDHGVELGLVVPLRAGWTLQPQLGAVPDAQFLPQRFADLRLERVFGAGWVGAASLRRSDYRDVRVERLALGVERYVGAWRAGYTANVTRLRGTHAVGHDLRLARGYGDGGEVGVQFATGREDALLGTQVVASDVRAWSIGGRHPLSAAWALRWNAGHVRQGALYARDGIALGLERRF